MIYIEELFSVVLRFQVSESKIFERDGPNVSSTVTISFTQVTLIFLLTVSPYKVCVCRV